MKNPKITVVIPVFNVEKYLRRCVDSVTGQTFRDIEILLIDDGSTDSSGQLCDCLALTDSRIRVLHKANGGPSDARNTGIDHARGEYLIFIDSDDYIDPDMLEILYGLTVRYGVQVAACTHSNHYKSLEKGKAHERIFVYSGQEAMKHVMLGKTMNISMCTKLIHRNLCANHRFCQGKTYEDVLYNPGLFLQVDRVAVTTRPMYHYWHRRNSITTAPFSSNDMELLDAHQYLLDQVRAHWPALEEVALYYLRWAKFLLLDKLLMTPDYRQLPIFRQISSDLRRDWKEIVTCPYFAITRRVSALALRINVQCYRMLLLLYRKKHEENE